MRRSSIGRFVALFSLLLLLLLCCDNSECLCPETEKESGQVSITYLFREAWGDCPCGCIYNRYWYFESGADGYALVGEWDCILDRTPPEWWEEASIAKAYFKTGGECPYSPWPECSDVNKTPRKNKEAEEAALWLSGSLVAPDTLYFMILEDLESIREDYGDSIPQARDVEFLSPWASGQLIITVTNEAIERFHAGEYDDLDSLNASLRLVSMEHLFSNGLVLSFEGRLNPKRLIDLYVAEPSVWLAEPNGRMGDWENVYPWVTVDLK